MGWVMSNRHNELYHAKSHGKIFTLLANPPPIRDFVNGGLSLN